MLRFEVNYTGADQVKKAFEGLYRALGRDSQRGILLKVGYEYVAETEKRFNKEYDVDRKKWAKLQPSTQRLKRKGFKGRGPGIKGPAYRGVWTGALASSIQLRLEGDKVIIGSDLPYAKTFHYGAKKGSFGSVSSEALNTNFNQSVPWGDIPPRRFIGRNNRLDARVIQIIKNELAKKIGIDPGTAGRDYL